MWLNTTQYWVKCGQTQHLGYYLEGWVKNVTQQLVDNNPIRGFVHIVPSAGLYLTTHFLACTLTQYIYMFLIFTVVFYH